MEVTIIGAGNMAKGLASVFVKGGHSVVVHARDVEKSGDLVAKDVTVKELGSDVAGDVVVLATPYQAAADVAKTYGNALDSKILVDISNPVDFNTFQLIPAAGTSGAEELAKVFPASKVVKAFNTTFAGTLLTGKAGGLALDVFVAGDDQGAKSVVSSLADDGGLRAIDAGPLANARHLEGFQLIHMTAQEQINGQWSSGIKFVA